MTEPGKDLPIGISRRRPFRRRSGRIQLRPVPYGHRCAMRPAAPPRIVLGMPAHQLDLQRLVTFVLECSLDSRLTRENVLARVE